MYALKIEGLKAGSMYALNKEYALNNGVRLTTRVYDNFDDHTKSRRLEQSPVNVTAQEAAITSKPCSYHTT